MKWTKALFGKTLQDKILRYFFLHRGQYIDSRTVFERFKDDEPDRGKLFHMLQDLEKDQLLRMSDSFERNGNVSNHVYSFQITHEGTQVFVEAKRFIIGIIVSILIAAYLPYQCTKSNDERIKPASVDSFKTKPIIPVDTLPLIISPNTIKKEPVSDTVVIKTLIQALNNGLEPYLSLPC
jgi:hypothetical protein